MTKGLTPIWRRHIRGVPEEYSYGEDGYWWMRRRNPEIRIVLRGHTFNPRGSWERTEWRGDAHPVAGLLLVRGRFARLPKGRDGNGERVNHMWLLANGKGGIQPVLGYTSREAWDNAVAWVFGTDLTPIQSTMAKSQMRKEGWKAQAVSISVAVRP